MTIPAMIQPNSVTQLKPEQWDQASQILANAFEPDPWIEFLIRDKTDRATALQSVGQVVLRYAAPYNHLYTTAETVKGVAAWLPPGQFPLNMMRFLDWELVPLLFKLGFTGISRISSLLKLDSYHDRDMPEPHWYLFMLGVGAAYQGQGIGATLLQPVLQQADAQGQSCYLETSTEGAVRFYQRQGFEVLRTGQLSRSEPTFWTMKRPPR